MACLMKRNRVRRPLARPATGSAWSGLLLLLVVSLGGLALGLAGWHLYATWKDSAISAEKTLLVADSSSKLIFTEGAAPDASRPAVVSLETDQFEEAEILTAPVPCANPTEEEPEKAFAPVIGEEGNQSFPLLPEKVSLCDEPKPPAMDLAVGIGPMVPPARLPPIEALDLEDSILVFLPPQVRPLGDTPMIRNWKTLSLAALLATAATVVPVQAQVAADTTDVKKLLERLEKSIMDMDQKIGQDMQSLKNSNTQLQNDLTPLKEEILKHRLKLDVANSTIKQLEIQLGKLGQDLDDLKKRLPASGVALYPPADKGTLDDIKTKLGQIEDLLGKMQSSARVSLSPASQGRVILVNLYNEDLLFVVNQKQYRVAPNTTVTLDSQPAGSLSYEVISGTWGLRARNNTTLLANETFTLTAR